MERYRNKSKIFISILLLFICMLFIMQLTVRAEGFYNGGGTGNIGAGKGNEGASKDRNAFLMYFAYKKDGEPATPGMLIYHTNNMPSAQEINLVTKVAMGEGAYPKLSPNAVYRLRDSHAPSPIGYNSATGSWILQGTSVREYLEGVDDARNARIGLPAGSERYKAYAKILCDGIDKYVGFEGVDGQAMWEEMNNSWDEFCIVLQPVAWLHPYGKGTADGLATADGWAQWLSDGGHSGYSHTFITGALYNCMTLQFERWGITVPTKKSIYQADYNSMHGQGLGIHIIDIAGNTQTTCNEPEIPAPHKAPDESVGDHNIVKNYRTMDEDGNMISDDGCFLKEKVCAEIIIEDEEEYKVVGWKTSTTTHDGIPSETWDTAVPGIRIKDNQTDLGRINLSTTEKCLYILLEKKDTPPPKPEPDANYIISESTVTRYISLSDPDHVKEMTLAKDNEFIWKMPAHVECQGHVYYDPCDGNCERDVEVEEDASCSDVGCTTENCPGGHKKKTTKKEKYNCGKDHIKRVGKCTDYFWKKNVVKVSLQNEKKDDYPDILATKEGWQCITNFNNIAWRIEQFTRTSKDEQKTSGDIGKNWDLKGVLLRGKDKLTVLEYKNEQLDAKKANEEPTGLKSVSSSGFTIANTDSGDRKTADYNETFTVKFIDKVIDNKTRWEAATGGQIDKHGNKKNPPCGDDQYAALENTLTVDSKVLVETYSGKSDGGINDTTCDSSVRELYRPSYNHSTGREVPSGGTIKFRPYIQMNYDVYGEKSMDKVYVIGEYERSMTPNDYAEISWNMANDKNLTLTSLQWSTHATPVKKWGAGNVLAGGAALSLKIDAKDRQEMLLTTYQCIVYGGGKEQIDKIGGSDGGLTLDKAVQAHTDYVAKAVEAFDNLNVEQWVTSDTGSSFAWDTGKAVGPGDDISFLKNVPSGQKAQDDGKYYFRGENEQGGSSAGEGDLDVKESPTEAEVYCFFTNTYGEIRYTSGKLSEIDTVAAVNRSDVGDKKGERMGNPVGDTVSNLINERTHVVDKLRAAVERGTGYDASGRSKTGVKWYNEAYDGVCVVVQKTSITLGYARPGERTSILDVRLTQKSDGQSDMFNDSKYNMSQYRTKPYSDIFNVEDKFSEFKGVDIFMRDMNMVFWSRPFYIPNMTTQDLH